MPFAHQKPLVLPARAECDARLERTCAAWRRWADDRIYTGRWHHAVMRSLLTLKMLVFAPSGAIAAAVTTSLPEHVGGERNWDYRFSWVRDSAFTLAAFLQLGCPAEAHAYFWWLMHASQLTHPRLQVLYYAVFLAIGQAGWWLGALFGLLHGLFAGTALVNVLLPLVHPRMGSPLTSAPKVALLEPPAS